MDDSKIARFIGAREKKQRNLFLFSLELDIQDNFNVILPIFGQNTLIKLNFDQKFKRKICRRQQDSGKQRRRSGESRARNNGIYFFSFHLIYVIFLFILVLFYLFEVSLSGTKQ